jgi:hypothetical protein
MSKASTLVSFLVMVCLLGGVRCVQWQAAANISAANHTLIWSTIQSGLTTYVPDSFSGTDHTDLAKYISDTLNTAWDPAWNVFVFELVGDPTTDAVVRTTIASLGSQLAIQLLMGILQRAKLI